MRILVASDAFKNSLPAGEVCAAIARGIRAADPGAQVEAFPLADGGEGTAEILCGHLGGQMVEVEVQDPLFRPIRARYGWVETQKLAVIEMAAASGLQLLRPRERNPLKTTTFGTGQLLLDALKRGARRILLCIGGSATHDCGIGMAAALGYRFLDANGKELEPCGENLGRIARIEPPAGEEKSRPNVSVLTDVRNPLLGPDGAARTYAEQKGADATAVDFLEGGTRNFADLVERQTGKALRHLPGAGAAGGLGFGACIFLDARLLSGVETVLEMTRFEEHLSGAALLLTGEGKLDEQTFHGKLIGGVTAAAERCGVPVVALCGALLLPPERIAALGLRAAFSIQMQPCSLEEALQATARNLEHCAFHVFRLWKAHP